MSVKYHISPETGRPNICRATVKPCPLGGEGDHYPSKEEAREAYEKKKQAEVVAPLVRKKQVFEPSQQETLHRTWGPAWEAVEKAREELHLQEAEQHKHLRYSQGLVKAGEKLAEALREEEDSSRREAFMRLAAVLHAKAMNPPSASEYWPSQEEVKTVKDRLPNDLQAAQKRMAELNSAVESLSEQVELNEEALERVTGFKTNPRYGVPTGVTTSQLWAGKQAGNYSSLPSRDVPVLKDTERFCTHCGKTMHYDDQGGYGRWKHVHGLDYCRREDRRDQGEKDITGDTRASVNPVCRYCGTGNPRHSKFRHQAYSDETSCSRCGGVSGYGIGD